VLSVAKNKCRDNVTGFFLFLLEMACDFCDNDCLARITPGKFGGEEILSEKLS